MKHFKLNSFATNAIGFCRTIVLLTICITAASALAQVTLVRPSGEVITSGDVQKISWKKEYPSTELINISLWDGRSSNWIPVASNVSADQGQFDWNVPNNLRGDRFRIRIDYLSSGKHQMSRTYFSIKGKIPPLSVNREFINNASSLKIYPNPATDRLSLIWRGEAKQVIVRNLLGVMLISKDLSSKERTFTFNTDGLSWGTYSVEVKFSDDHEEKKLVIIKK